MRAYAHEIDRQNRDRKYERRAEGKNKDKAERRQWERQRGEGRGKRAQEILDSVRLIGMTVPLA
jgi:hypothetical protein